MRERVWHGAGTREVKWVWEGARTWEGQESGRGSLTCVWDGAGAWECEGTARRGSGRGQGSGRGEESGMLQESRRVQEPGMRQETLAWGKGHGRLQEPGGAGIWEGQA